MEKVFEQVALIIIMILVRFHMKNFVAFHNYVKPYCIVTLNHSSFLIIYLRTRCVRKVTRLVL